MVLSAAIFIAALGSAVLSQSVDNSYVVQVGRDCNAICLDSLAKSAGVTCAAEYLGNNGDGTVSWVSITCATRSESLSSGSFAQFKSAARSKSVPVTVVEEDQIFSTQALWGADEVDGTSSNGERCSTSRLGKGVIIAVFDTGCTPKGNGFDDIKCKNYVQDGKGTNYCADGNSHGTHVAGTAASGFYGVAPAAKVACIRVLGDNGSGKVSGIISAVNVVAAYSRANKKARIVINMSLGGGFSSTLNSAVVAATKKTKIYFSLAAGNSNKDSKTTSPASASNGRRIIAVGAHDINGNRASFSNFGPKVQISAPGVGIESTIPGNKIGFKSGTSMAAPHVAGAMAALWSSKGVKPRLSFMSKGGKVTYPDGQKPKLIYQCN